MEEKVLVTVYNATKYPPSQEGEAQQAEYSIELEKFFNLPADSNFCTILKKKWEIVSKSISLKSYFQMQNPGWEPGKPVPNGSFRLFFTSRQQEEESEDKPPETKPPPKEEEKPTETKPPPKGEETQLLNGTTSKPYVPPTGPTLKPGQQGKDIDDLPYISQAGGITGDTIHPSLMTQNDWRLVVNNNCLLQGLTYEPDHANPIVRARRPAFKLRKDLANLYDSGGSQVISTGGIPEFQIFDDSSVTVVEASTAFSKAAARGNYDQFEVKTALSASYGIFSGSAGAEYGQESSFGSTLNEDESLTEMHASYNFPRVVVYLDELTLELSDELKRAVQNIHHVYAQDGIAPKRDLVLFEKHYGLCYPKCVHLGGRLHAMKSAKFVAGSNTSEKSSAMHASASASFSAPGFKAEVSASGASGSSSVDEQTRMRQDNNLAWEASGGDTTLVSNPPMWAATVTSHHSWRVTNYHDIIPLVDLLSLFPETSRFKLVVDETRAAEKPAFSDSSGAQNADQAYTFRIYSWEMKQYLNLKGTPEFVHGDFSKELNDAGLFWFTNTEGKAIPSRVFGERSKPHRMAWTENRLQWGGGSRFAMESADMFSLPNPIPTNASSPGIPLTLCTKSAPSGAYFRFCKTIDDFSGPTDFQDNLRGFICLIYRAQPFFLTNPGCWVNEIPSFVPLEQVSTFGMDVLFQAQIRFTNGARTNLNEAFLANDVPAPWQPAPEPPKMNMFVKQPLKVKPPTDEPAPPNDGKIRLTADWVENGKNDGKPKYFYKTTGILVCAEATRIVIITAPAQVKALRHFVCTQDATWKSWTITIPTTWVPLTTGFYTEPGFEAALLIQDTSIKVTKVDY